MTSQPECIVYPDGSKEWYLNGQLHRVDGPAIEWPDGSKHWFLNGQRHRTDGPAIECADGYKAWFLNDKKLDPEVSVKDPELKEKYLELICSMVIYLVHNS